MNDDKRKATFRQASAPLRKKGRRWAGPDQPLGYASASQNSARVGK
jgi:hypothetical protein